MVLLAHVPAQFALSSAWSQSPEQLGGEQTSEPLSADEPEFTEDPVVARFRTIVERNPGRGTSFDRVFGHYAESGHVDVLAAIYQDRITQSPDDATAWLLLGMIESRQGRDAEAVKSFQQAELLDETNPLPSYYLGETLVLSGRLKEAVDALQRSIQREPAPMVLLPVMQLLGRTQQRLGQSDEASLTWAKVEEEFADDLDVLQQIAEILLQEEQWEEALDRYERLIERSNDDPYARVRFTIEVADIKRCLGRTSEAILDFDRLLDDLSEDSWLSDMIRDRIESTFARQYDWAGLTRYYEKRITSHPKQFETLRRLAGTLVKMNRMDEAQSRIEEAIQLAPSDTGLRQALIDLLVHKKAFALAAEQYAELDRIEPNNPDYIQQWGFVLLEDTTLPETDRKQRAADVWMRLTTVQPDDSLTLTIVADLLLKAELQDRARQLYEKAVELAPEDPRFREYLGAFHHQQEQPELALAVWNKIVAGERRQVDNLMHLIGIFRAFDYDDEALHTAEETARFAPNELPIRFLYVQLLLEAEQSTDAITELNAIEPMLDDNESWDQYAQRRIEALQIADQLDLAIRDLSESLDQLDSADPNEKEPKNSALQFWLLGMYYNAQGDLGDACVSMEEGARAGRRLAADCKVRGTAVRAVRRYPACDRFV